MPEGFSFYRVEKLFDDVDMNIGFQQRKTNIAQGIVDVFLADLSLTPEFLKGQLEFLG